MDSSFVFTGATHSAILHHSFECVVIPQNVNYVTLFHDDCLVTLNADHAAG